MWSKFVGILNNVKECETVQAFFILLYPHMDIQSLATKHVLNVLLSSL